MTGIDSKNRLFDITIQLSSGKTPSQKLEELQNRIKELEALEETQRQKKEYYHEESAKEIIKRAELETALAKERQISDDVVKDNQILKGEVERLRAAFHLSQKMLDKYSEALDKIESLSTIETVEITKIAQEALEG